MTNYVLKMPRLGGKVNSISQPLGGLIGGGANSSSGSGMDGGNNRAVNRNILRKAFGNEAIVKVYPPFPQAGCTYDFASGNTYCKPPPILQTDKISVLKDLNTRVISRIYKDTKYSIIWTISGENYDPTIRTNLKQNIITKLNTNGIDISINNIIILDLQYGYGNIYYNSNLSHYFDQCTSLLSIFNTPSGEEIINFFKKDFSSNLISFTKPIIYTETGFPSYFTILSPRKIPPDPSINDLSNIQIKYLQVIDFTTVFAQIVRNISGLTPFRRVINGGDIALSYNSDINSMFQRTPNQVKVGSNIYGWKQSAGRIKYKHGLGPGEGGLVPIGHIRQPPNNGPPASWSGNPTYVYDSSNYIKFKKLQAINRNYNDDSFGGDQHYASQQAYKRTH